MVKRYLTLILVLILSVNLIVPSVSSEINMKDASNIDEDNSFNDALFDKYMTFMMKMGHMPSMSVCAIKDDKVVFSNAYGYSDLENKKEATEETIYIAHSVSKTVAATALMQLYDMGLFGLDEDINNHLNFSVRNPNHPNKNITFRMLLSHQSSLTDFVCHKIPGDLDMPDYPYPFLKEYLVPGGNQYSPKVWSDNSPGEAYEYSNIGYGLIGYLIERISGKSLNEFCKENIFIPLEMYNTSFRLSDLNVNNVAVPYMYCPVVYQKNNYNREMQYGCLPYAAGNLRTTTTDFSHFLIAHMNSGVWNGVRILENSTVEMMHNVQYPDSFQGKNSLPYCLGFFVKTTKRGDERIGHTGFFTAKIYMNHEENTGIIIFANSVAWPISTAWWPSVGRSILTNYVMDISKDIVENSLFWRANHI